MLSQGLPHCSPAATQATILSDDTPKAAPNLLPPEGYQGQGARYKGNHDLSKPVFNSGGTGKQVVQVWEDRMAVKPPRMEDQTARPVTLINLGATDDATAATVPVTKNININILHPFPTCPLTRVRRTRRRWRLTR